MSEGQKTPMVGHIHPELLGRILDLRILIARAGEQDSLKWWNSHALTKDGQWALKRLYPRHAHYAGARLSIASASLVHAQKIAQRPAVTLFGLGVELDAQVMMQLDLRRLDETPLDVPPAIHSTEELRRLLSEVVDLSGVTLSGPAEGSSNGALFEVGNINPEQLRKDEKLADAIQRLSTWYLNSKPNQLMVPYLRLI